RDNLGGAEGPSQRSRPQRGRRDRHRSGNSSLHGSDRQGIQPRIPRGEGSRPPSEGEGLNPLDALKIWVEAGQDPSLFWRLTYREIDVILAGVSDRLKREHNERAWLAW